MKSDQTESGDNTGHLSSLSVGLEPHMRNYFEVITAELFGRFRSWSIWKYVAVSAVGVVASFVGAAFVTERSQGVNLDRLQRLDSIQKELRASGPSVLVADSEFNTSPLQKSPSVEDVSRDVVQFGQSNGVQIKNIRVQPKRKMGDTTAQAVYEINASANYASFKYWMGDLMSRYPTMAVSTLSMQPSTVDPQKLDTNMTLTVFVEG